VVGDVSNVCGESKRSNFSPSYVTLRRTSRITSTGFFRFNRLSRALVV
jgi:hypothetical protein